MLDFVLQMRKSYYMKQNAKNDKPFTLNSHVLERVKAWENVVLGDQATSKEVLYTGIFEQIATRDKQIS